MNKQDAKVVAKAIGSVIGSVIAELAITAFYAWIVILAFPITFWQAFVIALFYTGMLRSKK